MGYNPGYRINIGDCVLIEIKGNEIKNKEVEKMS